MVLYRFTPTTRFQQFEHVRQMLNTIICKQNIYLKKYCAVLKSATYRGYAKRVVVAKGVT